VLPPELDRLIMIANEQKESLDCQPERIQVVVRFKPGIESTRTERKSKLPLSPLKSSNQCISIVDNSKIQLSPVSRCSCKNCLSIQAERTLSSELIKSLPCQKVFQFDKVLSGETTQHELYSYTQPHVLSVLRGLNATIFTYGSASSGKTYSLRGTSSEAGILQRALKDIFASLRQSREEDAHTSFCVEISYIELHNNSFRNLLKPHMTKVLARCSTRKSNAGGLQPCSSSSVTQSQAREASSGGREKRLRAAAELVGDERLELHRSAAGEDYFSGYKGGAALVNLEVLDEKDAVEAIAAGDRVMTKPSGRCVFFPLFSCLSKRLF
jgi:hypothetical protein